MRMLRRNKPLEAVARRLFATLVEQSRRPAFYQVGGVPDTLDGRFEMIGLHLFLLLRRLQRDQAERPEAEELGQLLFDTVFMNMDENLREMGVGDLSVGAKVKQMAQGFYGRAAAYDAGLASTDAAALAAALRRNLFGTVAPGAAQVSAMAAYVRDADRSLQAQAFSDLLSGHVAFAVPPQPSSIHDEA